MVLSRKQDTTKSMESDRPNSGGFAHLSEDTNKDSDDFIITEDPKSTSLYRGSSSPSTPFAQHGNEVKILRGMRWFCFLLGVY